MNTIVVMYIASFLICGGFILMSWAIHTKDIILGKIDILKEYNRFSQLWPCDRYFLSLIFSMLRHTLLPLAFAFVIMRVNVNVLNTILNWVALLYTISKIPLHKARRRDYITASDTSKSILKPVYMACTSVVCFSFINYFILMYAYYIRP